MAVIAMPALTLTLGAHPCWHWHRQPPPCAPRLRCHTGLLSRSSFPRTLAPNSHTHARELARGLVARAAIESTAQESGPSDGGAILLVGVTGGTGGSVVNGLLASGVDGSKLRVLTRSPDGAAARNLAASGVQAIAGDLDDPKRISEILKGRLIASSKILPSSSSLAPI